MENDFFLAHSSSPPETTIDHVRKSFLLTHLHEMRVKYGREIGKDALQYVCKFCKLAVESYFECARHKEVHDELVSSP